MQSSNHLCGVGIVVDLGQENTHPLIVQTLVPGGAAAKKGKEMIAPGDEIVSVAGQDPHTLTASQLGTLMIGPPGSTLTLQIKRGSSTHTLTLTREPVDQTLLQSVLPVNVESVNQNLMKVIEDDGVPPPPTVAVTPAPATTATTTQKTNEEPTVSATKHSEELPHPKDDSEPKNEGLFANITDFIGKMKKGAIVCCSQRG